MDGEGGGCTCVISMAVVVYGRPSHPYTAGTGHVRCGHVRAGDVLLSVCHLPEVLFPTLKWRVWRRGGAYSFVACVGHLTISHASLSRRSTVPTPNRDTSNVWALISLFPLYCVETVAILIPFLFGRGGGGGMLKIMHGHNGMTIDPRILEMPRRSTLGFRRPGRHCLHQARSAVRCWASRTKGELHPTKNRF